MSEENTAEAAVATAEAEGEGSARVESPGSGDAASDVEYWKAEARKAFAERDKAKERLREASQLNWSKPAQPQEEKKPVETDPKKEVKPAPGDQRIDQIMEQLEYTNRRLAFRDALTESGMNLDKSQMRLLEIAYHAQKPGDIGSWLSDMAAAFPSQSTTTQEAKETKTEVKTEVVQSAPNVSNQGAPIAGNGTLPDDPRQIPAHIWKGLSRTERLDRVNKFLAKTKF